MSPWYDDPEPSCLRACAGFVNCFQRSGDQVLEYVGIVLPWLLVAGVGAACLVCIGIFCERMGKSS
jgi:hypothetical protein